MLIQSIERVFAWPVAALLDQALQCAFQSVADNRLLLLNGLDHIALLAVFLNFQKRKEQTNDNTDIK